MFTSSACTDANPEVSISLDVPPPTRGGATEWSITIRDLNSNVVISGECDKRVEDLEYSFDGGETWHLVSSVQGADSDCADGTFRFSDTSLTSGFSAKKSTQLNIKLRSVLTVSKSKPSSVTIHYLAPTGPRAPGLRVVLGQLSNSDGNAKISLRVYARGRVQ